MTIGGRPRLWLSVWIDNEYDEEGEELEDSDGEDRGGHIPRGLTEYVQQMMNTGVQSWEDIGVCSRTGTQEL